MRRFPAFLAVPLAALALAALVGILRRDAVSSTPGQVVEQFLDRLAGGRYQRASELLVPGGSASIADLQRWKESVENGLGKVRNVRGETEWISGEESEATGILLAERRERRLRFALERENGRWRIVRLDEFWGEPAASRTDPNRRMREGWRLRARPARNR